MKTMLLSSEAACALNGVARAGWKRTGAWGNGHTYSDRTGLLAVIDCETKADNRHWLHVSYSYAQRIPSYDDTMRVKRQFFGPELKAIMVFPADSEHVNIHPYCLHLWACLDGDPLPDFTEGLGTI